ncbi:MAG: efflux RND transporter periplasmic adaptor subunit [Tidjanibacter sp.]|nr:efflux RND transporter periplasmic adaptor subunit [Tidjanibacter sp.]
MRVLLLIMVMIAACSCKPSGSHKKGQAQPILTVEASRAVDRTVVRQMRFQSRLQSNYDATIEPRVAGYLISKNYTKGMPVHKGQLLYRIDPSQLALTVEADRAALASAKVQLLEAANNLKRAVPLAKTGAISQSSLDQYRATHAAALAQLRSAETSLNNSKLELGYATIYSPIDGIIDDTGASPGDLVGPGSEFSTLSTISNTELVCANVAIPVSLYLSIREGKSDNTPTYDNSKLLSDITLILSDGTVYPHKGSYQYTKKDAGDRMGTIIIVVAFPNPKGVLKIGQSAVVSANVGAPAGAVLVPQRAVSQQQGINSVWILWPDSTVHYQKVVLGPTFGDLWIVDRGVKVGDVVLLSGQSKMRNGQKVGVKYSE